MSQKRCEYCHKFITANKPYCRFCGKQQSSASFWGPLPKNYVLEGRYTIEALIGQGGEAFVYRAVSRSSGRFCAVKEKTIYMWPPKEKPFAIRSFLQEINILLRLRHPNLPKVHDFFHDKVSERYYLIMDYVDGPDLEQKLLQQGQPFPEGQVRDWAIQLCHVLTYLHEQQPAVIFRDVKPENILLDQEGKILLVDFSTARFFQPKKANDTHIIGTPGYAAPEQYTGQTDARSDIHNLGVTLWRLLTLQEPADNPSPLPGVRTYNKRISTKMEAIIQKATAPEPIDRFQTAQGLSTALSR